MGSLRLYPEALGTTIELEGCPELEEWFRRVLKAWPLLSTASDESQEAADSKRIVIQATHEGYRRASPWTEQSRPFRHPLDAVCDCLVDVTKAYVEAHPELLCLHCAAVETAGGLLLFPNTYKAGKSTLSIHLAAKGHRLFTDDVLPIDPQGRGMALGFLPRLRIPLPTSGLAGIKDFLKERGGAHNHRYFYPDLEEAEFAPFDTKAAIRSFVLLERTDDATPPALEPIGRSEILKNALLRNFSHTVSGPEALIRLHGLVAASPCYKLTYHKAYEGADLLIRQFVE